MYVQECWEHSREHQRRRRSSSRVEQGAASSKQRVSVVAKREEGGLSKKATVLMRSKSQQHTTPEQAGKPAGGRGSLIRVRGPDPITNRGRRTALFFFSFFFLSFFLGPCSPQFPFSLPVLLLALLSLLPPLYLSFPQTRTKAHLSTSYPLSPAHPPPVKALARPTTYPLGPPQSLYSPVPLCRAPQERSFKPIRHLPSNSQFRSFH